MTPALGSGVCLTEQHSGLAGLFTEEWVMLRNAAVFGTTMVVHEPARLNRIARLQGRPVPRAARTVDRPREEWTGAR